MIGQIPTTAVENRRAVLALVIRYLLVAAGVVLAVAVLHYTSARQVERATRETAERLNVELGRIAIARTLDTVADDLRYLAEHSESRALFPPATPDARARLASTFRIFARQKRIYDQVRFLDLRGLEIVRVNAAAGAAVVVPDAELQNKADRYYFRETAQLAPGELYASPLDLNIERDEVEYPLRPMMRFGTPVTDRNGSKVGVLVLNYRGDALLDAFRAAIANIGDHAMLLNGEGFWLSSPTRGEEWGFMLEHRRSFALSHPEAWQRIRAQDSGQFAAGDAHYTFSTFKPGFTARVEAPAGTAPTAYSSGAAPWKIVARLPAHHFAAAMGAFARRYLLLYATLFALAAAAGALLARAVHRRRLAEAQAAFGQRFREILENVSLLALGLDKSGKIIFVNDALCQRVGYHREALIGCDWLDALVADEHRERSRALFNDVVRLHKHAPRHECALRTAASGKRLIAWSITRLTDADGNAIGVTCIGDDVTEAREAEEALRKVTRAVEQSPSTVMITDTRGAIEYVNPKFTQLTGYTLDEVRGKNPRLLKSGETSPQEYQRLWDTVVSGGEWRGVFHNRKKSGELYWEATCISPIRDASGAITHLLAVKEDITERRRLEEEVEQRKRDGARNQALAEVGRMANMVAHDLRNPLSSVKMTLQIFGRRPAERWDPEERELQQIALEQVRHMEEILSDLLTYSRPDSMVPEWLGIDRVLDAAILIAQKHITDHRVTVKARYRPGLPTLLADSAKLRQVFANLLENAAQATEGINDRAHEIDVATELELRPDGSWIRVEISDNGAGLAPGYEEKVFEPFYTTRARGTGLGLAIVRRIVELHGGKVTLQQHGKHCTCATVVLPSRAVEVCCTSADPAEDSTATLLVETGASASTVHGNSA
ncbi:MAG: PAS domain S-box protein [Betaproteobacteria bacterium]|nr:PAS domain S-box protein [Betaproteobacteria bacterium]